MTKKNNIIKRYEMVGIIAALALIFINLYHLTSTGYLGDDIYNSCIQGNIRESGDSLWEYIFHTILGWAKAGRFFPVTIIVQYLVFSFIQNLVAYKIYLIVFTLLDILLVARLIKMITKSTFAELIVMLILGLSMPVYAAGAANPLYMFNGLMQSVLLFGFAAIYFYIKYSETTKTNYAVVSVVFSLLAMMTYEVGYAFPVVIFFLSFFYQKSIWGIIKSQFWNIISTLGMFGFTYLLRVTSSSISYDGIAIAFDFDKMIQTFIHQFLGAIPGYTYLVAKTNYNGKENTDVYFQTIPLKVIVILIIFASLLAFAYWGYNFFAQKIELKRILLLLVMGFLIWVIPTTLISISSKYQNEISDSKIPYMPFFMEIFGMAIVMTSLLCMINYLIKHKVAAVIQIIVLTGLFCFVLPIYHGASYKEQSDNEYTKGIREDFVTSIQGGILEQVKDDALIVLDNRFSEPVSSNIYTAYSKRNLKTTYWVYQKDVWNEKYKSGEFETAGGISYYDASNDNVWLTKAMTVNGCGQVMLGKVKTVYFDINTGQLLDVFLDQVSIYTDVKTNSSNSYYNTLGLFSDGALTYTEYPIYTYSDYYNVEEVDETAFLVRFGDTTIKSIDTMLFENVTIHEE